LAAIENVLKTYILMDSSAIKQEDAGEHKSSVANLSNFPAGLRVLVVDDDPLCLKIIAQMLKRCDYEGQYWLVGGEGAGGTTRTLLLVFPLTTSSCTVAVCTCVNAASALEQLRDKTHNYDLVLSDVYMPGGHPLKQNILHLLCLIFVTCCCMSACICLLFEDPVLCDTVLGCIQEHL
jgi:CheY-like chemotaxis protein